MQRYANYLNDPFVGEHTEEYKKWCDGLRKAMKDLLMLEPDRTPSVIPNAVVYEYLKASFPQYEFTDLQISPQVGDSKLEVSVNLKKNKNEWFEITYYMKRPRNSSYRHMMSTIRQEFLVAVEKYIPEDSDSDEDEDSDEN